MKPNLQVFIKPDCGNCDETLKIVNQLQQEYADLIIVEVINIADDQAHIPDVVFATPTYMFNQRIVSLGNPSPHKVAEWVKEATI